MIICTTISITNVTEVYNFMKDQVLCVGYLTKYNLNEFLGIESTTDEKYIGWSTEDVLNAVIAKNPDNGVYTLEISEPRSLVNLKAPTIKDDNVTLHAAICKELTDLYERKNHDYGDAFHDTFVEEGFAMARIRLTDKLKRFKTLSKTINLSDMLTEKMEEDDAKKVLTDRRQVLDESIRDTLIDLANYAIMTVMEIDRHG